MIIGSDELARCDPAQARAVLGHPRLRRRRVQDDHARAACANGGGWAPGVDRLIVATQSIDERLIAELVAFCRREHVKLSIVPPARGIFGTAVQLHHIADLPVVEYNTWDVSRSTLLLKRTLDVAVAAVILRPHRAAVRADRARDPAQRARARRSTSRRARASAAASSGCSSSARCWPTPRRCSRRLVEFDELDEPVFKLAHDPRVTRARPLPAAHEPRRAAAAPERPEGRHEPRRPAARAGRARPAVPARAPVPARGQARPDRARCRSSAAAG